MKYVDKFHLHSKNARLIILFLLIAICRTTARTRNKLAKKDMTEKQVIITAIGQCAGDEGLPVNVVPMDIIREGRFDYYIDGVVLIRQDFDDGFEGLIFFLLYKPLAPVITCFHFLVILVKLQVLRCNQGEIMETCTSVLNYVNSTDLCELLSTPVDAYTKALNQIEPRPLCPLKKGSFFLHHLPTDDSLLKLVLFLSPFIVSSQYQSYCNQFTDICPGTISHFFGKWKYPERKMKSD